MAVAAAPRGWAGGGSEAGWGKAPPPPRRLSSLDRGRGQEAQSRSGLPCPLRCPAPGTLDASLDRGVARRPEPRPLARVTSQGRGSWGPAQRLRSAPGSTSAEWPRGAESQPRQCSGSSLQERRPCAVSLPEEGWPIGPRRLGGGQRPPGLSPGPQRRPLLSCSPAGVDRGTPRHATALARRRCDGLWLAQLRRGVERTGQARGPQGSA